MSDVVRLDEGEEDVVVLLALVLVHSSDLVRFADQRIVCAPTTGDNEFVMARILKEVLFYNQIQFFLKLYLLGEG